MKNICTTIALLIVASITALAQVPQGFSYQAVVRDANNAIVASTDISVTVSILQGSADGTAVYSETHATTTNVNGLFNIVVGNGTTSNDFSAIDWSSDKYYLKTETTYGTSTTQMLGVPYAMYAAKTDLSGVYTNNEIDSKMANLKNLLAEMQLQRDLEKCTLKGKFSVSATRQVLFSQGNLQYQASTSTWRFADNQWDCIGKAAGNTTAETNRPSQSEWIDLFGWGTSGWESGANTYMPYSTNEVQSDYYPGNSSTNGLTGECVQADWGVYNAIYNGGNKAGLWRTLTSDEWDYLFNSRTDASDKYGVACVNGVNGLVILPDEWTQPEGTTFNPGIHSKEGAEYFAQKNNYTIPQWAKMEAMGAVFFPTAGRREGTQVLNAGMYGYYWSSSPYDDRDARRMYFSSFKLTSVGWYYRSNGFSVRLVREQ